MKRLLLGTAVAVGWAGLAAAQDYTIGISNTVVMPPAAQAAVSEATEPRWG